MKLSVFFAALAALFIAGAPPAEKLTLRCEISGCGQSMQLYRFDGIRFIPMQAATSREDAFVFEVPKSDPQFYYVGATDKLTLPVILGQEPDVVIKGACNNIRNARVENSDLNNGYQAVKAQLDQFKVKSSQQASNFQRNMRNDEVQRKIAADMAELDKAKLQFLDSLKSVNPFFARVAALNTYLSYPNNGQEYENELVYFTDQFFRFADFNDKGYNTLPWVYESFKSYAQTLSSVNIDQETHQHFIETALKRMPSGSAVQKLAYGGVMAALKERNHPNYAVFAKAFVEDFRKTDPDGAAIIEAELKKAGSTIVGGIAPDFTQDSPDGKPVNLSDFRGKIVLVDFWASWCGPCRRENPNVVRVYNHYKSKGFEILGVSLDNSKDRWLQAIEADGLTWQHVSDLKGWQNEVAQTFGVRSIPHTILLDQEGRILARGLRGEALEQKLQELLGE